MRPRAAASGCVSLNCVLRQAGVVAATDHLQVEETSRQKADDDHDDEPEHGESGAQTRARWLRLAEDVVAHRSFTSRPARSGRNAARARRRARNRDREQAIHECGHEHRREVERHRGTLGQDQHQAEDDVQYGGQNDRQRHGQPAAAGSSNPGHGGGNADDKQKRQRRCPERPLGHEHVDQKAAQECSDQAVFDAQNERCRD